MIEGNTGAEEWDAFVRQHPLGWMCALSNWQHVIESAFPHIRGQVITLRDAESGTIRAGLPLYTVKSWLLGTRLVSVPFATLSDPLVTNHEQFSALLEQAVGLSKREHASSIEVRAWKHRTPESRTPFTQIAPYRHQFVRLDKSQDELWRQLHATTIRQRIKRAIRNGIAISEGNASEDIAIFCRLLSVSRRRLGLPFLPERFFRSLCESFENTGYVRILIARHASRPVAVALFLDYGETTLVEYIGEDAMMQAMGAGKLLYWEAMRDAHARGRSVFSMGRTHNTNEGLMRYKERWGAVSEPLTRFFWPAPAKPEPVLTSPRYQVAQAVFRHAPYPVCRLLGAFFYRHWG